MLAGTTTKFQGAGMVNAWVDLGQVDITQNNPSVVFTRTAGTGTTRYYVGGIRFTEVVACAGTANPTGCSGPINAGATTVTVTGVSASAQAVTIYANHVQIGQKTTGLGATTQTVTTSALVKGTVIGATQTIGGQESCEGTAAPFTVGSGAPTFRIALSLKEDATLTGPIGAHGSSATTIIKYLGATGSGAAQGPTGVNFSVTPSLGWQTLSWTNGVSDCWKWNPNPGASFPQVDGTFAIVDGLAIVADDPTDTGEYKFYIDNFKNGNTLIFGFEGLANGAADQSFSHPSTSGSTVGILTTPNYAAVSNTNADVGTNCYISAFQFANTSAANWVRYVTSGPGGTLTPMVDLSQPISVRVLVLPAGASTAALTLSQPASQTVSAGSPVTMSITATTNVGGGTLAYQWKTNNVNIAGANSSSYSIASASASNAGSYSCAVTNVVGVNTYSSECNQFTLSITTAVAPSSLTNTYNPPNFTLTWSAGVLQSTATLLTTNTPWVDVGGASSPFTTNASTGIQFFRLRGTQ